jgi:5-methylcytosine-specific restriction endonuclease McrA
MSGVRSTHRWQLLCRSLIPRAILCAICHRPLVHGAPARSRYSPSVDHIVPISLGGDPFDRANLRVVHYGCNASRGNGRRGRRTPQTTSRGWFSPRRADAAGWLGEPEERARWW